jgi:hypothetical protein
MPLKFWDEAYLTATFLINRTLSRVIGYQTPMERVFGQAPNYSLLRTFGWACWPNLRPYNTQKLAFRSTHCVFLGYSNQHRGYKCLEPKSGRVYISQDVIFDETVFPFSSLHPNAGAQLKAKLLLLHPMMCTNHGDVELSNMNNSADIVEESYIAARDFANMSNSGA